MAAQVDPGNPDDATAAWRTARREALDSALAGNLDQAEQKLKDARVARNTRRAVAVDDAEELATLSFNLADVAAEEAAAEMGKRALRFLERIQRGRDYTVEEQTWAGLLEGALSVRVHRDMTRARAAYHQVLKFDPQNAEARARLAAIDLQDVITDEKIKEQLLAIELGRAADVQREVAP